MWRVGEVWNVEWRVHVEWGVGEVQCVWGEEDLVRSVEWEVGEGSVGGSGGGAVWGVRRTS